MDILLLCGFSVVSAIGSAILKNQQSPIAPYLGLFASVMGGWALVRWLNPIVVFLKSIFAQSGVESYFVLMLKALGVTLACRFSADICRDCGESTLSSRIEMAGKVALVAISLPVIKQIFMLAKDMLG